MPHFCSARLRSQYAFLAADNFALCSGVSHNARLALYSSEFMVAFKRSLRLASAAGRGLSNVDVHSVFLEHCGKDMVPQC